MDKEGLIYELTEEQKAYLNSYSPTGTETIPGNESQPVIAEKILEIHEDVARLEGYLKGRADSDRSRRGGKGNNSDLAG
jgi:hypothetical protein